MNSWSLLFNVRYFKQIAKSVRANGSAASGSEENADDFLGCINIPLNVSLCIMKSKSMKEIFLRFLRRKGFRAVNWPLSFWQELPVAGYDTWFKLEPRSSTSKVQGECHLILKLFTSQVCATKKVSRMFLLYHGEKPPVILYFLAERHSFVEERLKCLYSQETAESDSGIWAHSC